MTHGAVRAAANKFVPFFEGYDAAPVSAKMPARPNRDSHAGGGENNAAPPDGVARRNEAHPQPPIVRAGPKQVKRYHQRALWRSEEHTSELQSPDHLVC